MVRCQESPCYHGENIYIYICIILHILYILYILYIYIYYIIYNIIYIYFIALYTITEQESSQNILKLWGKQEKNHDSRSKKCSISATGPRTLWLWERISWRDGGLAAWDMMQVTGIVMGNKSDALSVRSGVSGNERQSSTWLHFYPDAPFDFLIVVDDDDGESISESKGWIQLCGYVSLHHFQNLSHFIWPKLALSENIRGPNKHTASLPRAASPSNHSVLAADAGLENAPDHGPFSCAAKLNMGVSENSVPLNPMVNDHYPVLKWL